MNVEEAKEKIKEKAKAMLRNCNVHEDAHLIWVSDVLAVLDELNTILESV